MSKDAPAKPSRKRVLIAEDDPTIRDLLERSLGLRYEIVLAEDGASALALATKEPLPDVIILDIMMPTIDGLGVAQRLKLFPEVARVPVLFLTARDTSADKIRAIQVGARHYVTKPFKISDLVNKIEAVLRGS